ncbi:MAG TPA: hypothetical protein PKD61_13590 [Polyangiaceae bacterium]|nr:hypothetical protein [Polyangiaceae bacterium]
MRSSAAILGFVGALGPALVASAQPSPRKAPLVQTTCAQVSAEQADELASRIALTLSAQSAQTELPRSVVVACDDSRAWVIWDVPPAELLKVAPGPQFIESVLEAIEARLRQGKAPEANAEPTPNPASPTAPEPIPESSPQTAGPAPQTVRQFTHGGLSLGASIELLPEPLSPPLGGRFDVGVGLGLLSIVLSESARIGSAPRGPTFGYDVGVGVGWGAPYDARHNVGAKALIGVDWFSVNGTAADSAIASGVAEVGGVGALYVSDYALWFGLAGRYRMRPQTYGSPLNLELPHFTAMLSVGGAVLVNVSRRSER